MKYFVVSDIHSFYTELKEALDKAGFDKKNKNHTLIVCGDIFDRGEESAEVYKFLKSVPKARRILIRGNHEQLFLKLLEKKFPHSHDFHNRTVDTFCQIAGMEYVDGINTAEYLRAGYEYSYGTFAGQEYIAPECQERWDIIKEKVSKHAITKWLKSNEWRDYYEVDKFIFVHSFIPTKVKQELIDQIGIYAYASENPKHYEYDHNWRISNDWDRAIWNCPYSQYALGLFKPEEDNGKVLVCGHWHTSDFYKHLKNIHIYDDVCAPIYYSKGLIGLDGGCMYNYYTDGFIHPQNVLVIDENFDCYDKFGCKLEELKNKVERIIRTVTIDKDGNEISGPDDFFEK